MKDLFLCHVESINSIFYSSIEMKMKDLSVSGVLQHSKTIAGFTALFLNSFTGRIDFCKNTKTPESDYDRSKVKDDQQLLHLFRFVGVVEFLLQSGADVHAKDKGGLVPLHNACSYGHYEVTELLVNVSDLWKFTPLHDAAAKGKYEIVKLLLKHGPDASKKNRDGHTPQMYYRNVFTYVIESMCKVQTTHIVRSE